MQNSVILLKTTALRGVLASINIRRWCYEEEFWL